MLDHLYAIIPSLRGMLPSWPLFEIVVLENPKFFFQLNHQVDINLHLMEATGTLRISRFNIIFMYFYSHKPFGF